MLDELLDMYARPGIAQGQVVTATDPLNGTLMYNYEYTPYGQVTITPNTSPAEPLPVDKWLKLVYNKYL